MAAHQHFTLPGAFKEIGLVPLLAEIRQKAQKLLNQAVITAMEHNDTLRMIRFYGVNRQITALIRDALILNFRKRTIVGIKVLHTGFVEHFLQRVAFTVLCFA